MVIPPGVREAVLRRSGGLCEGILSTGTRCCSAGDWRGRLVLHHIDPKGMGGRKRRDTEKDLVALCPKCHSARHGIEEMALS
ncbi:HNH endonuclease [Patescibacteria group bacterium]|nr:HNH endonuclease [Patescibacteria group bacterium]